MKRLLLVLISFFILHSSYNIPTACADPPAPVPKTGQTTSYLASDDGALQDGVTWPAPRFTDNANGTVADNLTGLIWLQNASCTDTAGGIAKGSGSLSWSNAITWSNALANGACGLNDGSIAGQWRLPSIRELKSLVDRSRTNPALPAGHPFSDVQSGSYWSSSTYTSGAGEAWNIFMDSGIMSRISKSDALNVWPVRTGL